MAGVPFIVLPLALGAVTSGNARTAKPADHLGEFNYRSMVWGSNGASNLWVRGDLGVAQAIDYVGMLAATAQSGTTIRVRLGDTQAEVDGTADYDSGAIAFINPSIVRTDGLYHSHHELPSTMTKRWWRIDIGGHSGDFEASMLVMGKKLQPARYYDTTWTVATRDLGSVTFARNGVPGFAAGAKLRSMQFKLSWINEAESEAMFQPVNEAMGKTAPFLTCFDPEVSIYRQRRTFFGFFEDQPSIGKVAFDRFEQAFQVLSLF